MEYPYPQDTLRSCSSSCQYYKFVIFFMKPLLPLRSGSYFLALIAACEHFSLLIKYGSGDTTAVQRLELRRLPLSESCCLPMLSCWWRRAHTKWDESFSSGPPGPAS